MRSWPDLGLLSCVTLTAKGGGSLGSRPTYGPNPPEDRVAGRHPAHLPRPATLTGALRRRRTHLILLSVTLVTALLVGAVAFWPGGSKPAPTASVDLPTAGPVESRDPDRATAAERPSRGGDRRADRPDTSPSPSEQPPPASEPSPTEPEPVPDSGDVITTGSCEASYYWEPQPTASGEVFDPEAMTAAHKTWDFNTRVRVTNPATGDSVVVRINDRGPYVDGRCLDLARGAFREIASLDSGVITVTYEVLSD
jgi:rare lipoprotein A